MQAPFPRTQGVRAAAQEHLLGSQVESVCVEEELGLVVKLGGELLHVGSVVQAVLPGGGHGVKQAVAVVKAASLQHREKSS
jgi:hypothetical protein